MHPSTKLANKTWKEGDDVDAFVVFPDDVSFHEARQLIGPVFGAHEPLTMWLLEGFENGKDPTLNACTMGLDIYNYLHVHGGTVLGKRGGNGALEAAAVIKVYESSSSSSSGGGCWNWLKGTIHFTKALLSIYWSTGVPLELYHPKFKRERCQFLERVDLMRNGYVEGHKKAGLDGHYWYIAFVAVHSESQGKGIGGELMRRIGQAADQQRMACYLETFGDKNIRFYRAVGYEVVANIELVDEKSQSTMSGVGMVRSAV